VIEADDLTIDLATKRIFRDGTPVSLTPTEWRLVEQLARHRGKLITHKQLLQAVWGPGYATETNYLRVHFTNIRRKLERDPAQPRHFVTEPGMGYRFDPDTVRRP
jgi:two-component system, OmpR family, KDP operon response regulator KdpE